MKQKYVVRSAIVGLAAVLAALLSTHKSVEHRQRHVDGGLHYVAYVNDGDTVKLDNGERVRLIGIDTPEAHENEKLLRDVRHRHLEGQVQLAMGKEAARFTKALLAHQKVRLEFDVEERDKYGRLLAYVYLPDGTFVNEKIIRAGYAYPLTIPPNVRYADEFKQWFDEARNAKRGLWSQGER